MPDINSIKDEISLQFPEYSFFITRRLSGRCIAAKDTKYRGADVFVKSKNIIVEPSIPEWKTRFILGAGAIYKKLADKEFSVPALRLREYLAKKYEVRLRT